MTTTTARTAHRDQYDAASTEAASHFAAMIHHHNAHTVATRDGWIAQQVNDLRAAMLTGTAHLCHHIGASPTVVYAAAWDPGRMVCTACVPTLIPHPDEDSTCDRCRRHSPVMNPGAVNIGPLLFTFGLCTPCATRTGTTRPDAARRH